MRAIAAVLLAFTVATGVAAASPSITISAIVDVSNDQTAQNETPIAINPADSSNILVGANDWNLNEGCAVAASTDGGATWQPSSTYPNGFLPGVTRFTDLTGVPGTGIYDVAGDPSVGFSPNGSIAYYACLGYNLTQPFQGAVLVSKSTDGGLTWSQTGLTQVTTFKGKGVSKGSFGQAVDHDNLYVAANGDLYVTWAQFNGGGSHSPVWVAVSHDEGATWKLSKITAGPVRANQDQRVVADASGQNAYVVFDNGVQGGKGTALYAARSTDRGLTWSTPVQFAALTNAVCLFPPDCFNIDGSPFRAGGSYPAVAYDTANDRLDVATADIRGTYAQIFFYSLDPNDLGAPIDPTVVSTGNGDHFSAELSAAPDGSRLDLSYYDRSYSGNDLVDLTYAMSTDGGQTWTEKRVTSNADAFDPAEFGVPGDTAPRPFIGDYNGIASTSSSALMAWTGVGPSPDPVGNPNNLEIEFATATP